MAFFVKPFSPNHQKMPLCSSGTGRPFGELNVFLKSITLMYFKTEKKFGFGDKKFSSD
jgi:hypothetical protein